MRGRQGRPRIPFFVGEEGEEDEMKRDCKQVGVRESEAGVGVLRRPEGHESTFAPVVV